MDGVNSNASMNGIGADFKNACFKGRVCLYLHIFTSIWLYLRSMFKWGFLFRNGVLTRDGHARWGCALV